MSTDVLSHGLMAPIMTPIVDRDDLSEELYDMGIPLRINYEGTLAYIDHGGAEQYGLLFGTDVSPEELALAGVAAGLDLAMDQVRPFVCLWYNGSDSDMDMLTLKEFLSQ